MEITMLKGKIHRATVVEAKLDYVGSITVDEDLLDASGIFEYEKVQIVDINNGSRFETYTIAGERGSGLICLNGAAARCVSTGDKIIIMAYAQMRPEEVKQHPPKVVFVDDHNKIHRVTRYEKHGSLVDMERYATGLEGMGSAVSLSPSNPFSHGNQTGNPLPSGNMENQFGTGTQSRFSQGNITQAPFPQGNASQTQYPQGNTSQFSQGNTSQNQYSPPSQFSQRNTAPNQFASGENQNMVENILNQNTDQMVNQILDQNSYGTGFQEQTRPVPPAKPKEKTPYELYLAQQEAKKKEQQAQGTPYQQYLAQQEQTETPQGSGAFGATNQPLGQDARPVGGSGFGIQFEPLNQGYHGENRGNNPQQGQEPNVEKNKEKKNKDAGYDAISKIFDGF